MHDPNPSAMTRVLSDLTERGRDCVEMVALEETPRIYALYCHEEAYEHVDAGVMRWVFAMPDGRTIIVGVDKGDKSVIFAHSLHTAADRWAGLYDAELVMVTGSADATAYL